MSIRETLPIISNCDLYVGNDTGWLHLSWFGTFRPFESGWIFHQQLGWLFAKGNSEDNVWLWSNRLGWLWTSRDAYPFLYGHADGDWFFMQNVPNRTILFRYATRQWIDL